MPIGLLLGKDPFSLALFQAKAEGVM